MALSRVMLHRYELIVLFHAAAIIIACTNDSWMALQEQAPFLRVPWGWKEIGSVSCPFLSLLLELHGCCAKTSCMSLLLFRFCYYG